MKSVNPVGAFVAGLLVGVLVAFGAMYLQNSEGDFPANSFRWNGMRGGHGQEVGKPHGAITPPIRPVNHRDTFKNFGARFNMR